MSSTLPNIDYTEKGKFKYLGFNVYNFLYLKLYICKKLSNKIIDIGIRVDYTNYYIY